MVKKFQRKGSHSVEFSTTIEETVNGEMVEVELEVEADVAFGSPGRTSGPPEDCYPPEPDDVDITGIWQVDFVPSPTPRYESSEASFPVPPENAGLIPSNRRGKYVRVRRREDLEKNTPKKLLEELQERAIEAAQEAAEAAYDDYVDSKIDEAREADF